MIHNLLDLYRTLTDPDRLKLLLNTLLSGWVGYAVLFGVVESPPPETVAIFVTLAGALAAMLTVTVIGG